MPQGWPAVWLFVIALTCAIFPGLPKGAGKRARKAIDCAGQLWSKYRPVAAFEMAALRSSSRSETESLAAIVRALVESEKRKYIYSILCGMASNLPKPPDWESYKQMRQHSRGSVHLHHCRDQIESFMTGVGQGLRHLDTNLADHITDTVKSVRPPEHIGLERDDIFETIVEKVNFHLYTRQCKALSDVIKSEVAKHQQRFGV
jgi:hypothetical protein